MMRALYTLTMYLLTPVILYRLAFRGLRARGYFSRWFERFGFFPDPKMTGSIWVHAVSVGEVNAAAPLIDALRERYADHPFVVTTVTPTGSDRVRQLWGDLVFHVYLPYDLPAAIRRFLTRVQPRVAVIMETEIWPNLFRECERSGVPIVVANARLSRQSLDGYGPVRPLARAAIRSATFVAAQSQQDAERFLELGTRPERLHIVGNVKYDMRVPLDLKRQAAAWRERWGAGRPTWMAASTHEGEEQAIIEAHSQVLRRFPDALLLVAPRHPERFRPMAQLCRSYGFRTACRTEEGMADAQTQCFVIDTLGELVPFCAAADIAFVAGSLEAIGGHNVLEPAALGVPVIVGPHTFNFEEVTDALLERGAALRVPDADALAAEVQRLLGDPAQREAMGAAALGLVECQRGAVARTLRIIERVVAGKQPITRNPDARRRSSGRGR
ncbi:lipid IV(A) 3-deoxy-D-manno-octulosonic acid transferase [Chiayiivirga flava]|uniref:3-deoxy-D-manno-octulosonic acid transferase n=1 Tax=Chiayiivirga flava TaxID=659595 RepID=A0A7W8D4T7_9GAMM|nr:3-deoxy-D-manno-octulosonic-acid transferase [Chiayiivirga flava]